MHNALGWVFIGIAKALKERPHLWQREEMRRAEEKKKQGRNRGGNKNKHHSSHNKRKGDEDNEVRSPLAQKLREAGKTSREFDEAERGKQERDGVSLCYHTQYTTTLYLTSIGVSMLSLL